MLKKLKSVIGMVAFTIRRISLFSLFVLFSTNGSCVGKFFERQLSAKRSSTRPVVCIMMPKCGTHLLAKCLAVLGKPIKCYDYKQCGLTKKHRESVRALNQLPPPNHYKGALDPVVSGQIQTPLVQSMLEDRRLGFKIYWTHFAHTQTFEKFLDDLNSKKILIMRDPRAMVASLAHMLQKGFREGEYIDFEPLILDLIDARKKNYIRWGVEVMQAYPIVWEKGICEYYKQFMKFPKGKNCLVVKFENLVGVQGGGSEEAQINEIQNIGYTVGIKLNREMALEVGRKLFGDSGSFREGKIDGWKKYFTPAIKEAFKKVLGANQLLIDLGYEKDDQW